MGDIGEIWGTLERTPSVHSKVCRSYSPYRLAYGTALGLITTCLTWLG